MNNIAAKEVKKHLEPGEDLIWAGQPQQGIVFEAIDIFKTVYMIGFLLFTCFVIKVVAKSLIVVAILIGMIFFPFIILLTIGRFFIDARLRKRTFYGLTNKRIIIKSDKFPKVFRSIYLDAQLKVEFLPNLGDTSTIDLGIQQPSGGGRAGGVGWSPNGKSYTSLYRLRDGNFVHQKIREILNLIDKNVRV